MNYVTVEGPIKNLSDITLRLVDKANEAAWPKIIRDLSMTEDEMERFQDRLVGIERRWDAVMAERKAREEGVVVWTGWVSFDGSQ